MTGASHSVENTNTQLKRYQKKENRFPLLILGRKSLLQYCSDPAANV